MPQSGGGCTEVSRHLDDETSPAQAATEGGWPAEADGPAPHPAPAPALSGRHPISLGGGSWGGAHGALARQQAGRWLLPSAGSPLLRRKASCLGSRPRKSFSMTLASWEPPGLRMQLL